MIQQNNGVIKGVLERCSEIKGYPKEEITNEVINGYDWLMLAEAMYLANRYKITVTLLTSDRDFTMFGQEIAKFGVTVRGTKYM